MNSELIWKTKNNRGDTGSPKYNQNNNYKSSIQKINMRFYNLGK